MSCERFTSKQSELTLEIETGTKEIRDARRTKINKVSQKKFLEELKLNDLTKVHEL